MPRRFFKRVSRQRHRLLERWYMRPFRVLLANPAYWSLHRRQVTRALALGLFVAFVPLPVHILVAAALAIALRVNVPVAVSATFISNPLTAVPFFYVAYEIGANVLDVGMRPFTFELSWNWLTSGLLPIWRPFLLGCLLMGLATSVTGYVVLGSIWHLTLVLKYRRRHRRTSGKSRVNEQKSAREHTRSAAPPIEQIPSGLQGSSRRQPGECQSEQEATGGTPP